MDVEPNILVTVHQGAPFVGCCGLRSQPTPKGRPFIMRYRHLPQTERHWGACPTTAGDDPFRPLLRRALAYRGGDPVCKILFVLTRAVIGAVQSSTFCGQRGNSG